jgi:sugar lactone lactonase YvrE
MTRRIFTAAAVLLAALLAVPAIRHWREQPPPPPPPPQPLKTAWIPAEAVAVGAGGEYLFGLALAADGRRLVYPAAKAGVVTLWLHDLRNGEARALPGSDGAAAPFWSPDGSRVGFFATGRVRAIDLAGGSVSDLADAPSPRGGAWNAAGDLLYAPAAGGPLMKRSADGAITPFTTLETSQGESSHSWPAFLPDGRHVVFLVTAADRSRGGIWIASLEDAASRRRLIAADTQAVVAAHTLLYLNDLALMAQPIDPQTWEPAGPAALAGLPAGRGPLGQTFATAAGDVLIFGAPGTTLRELRWVSRAGEPLGRASEPVDAWDVRIAPDGRRVVVTEIDPQLRTLDVFIRSGSQPVPTRLSLSTDVDESGVWSPDGLRIAWAARRRQIMIRGAGAVLPEQTIATLEPPVQVWDWSRDGQTLLVGRTHPETRDDLWLQPPVEGTPAQPYVTAAFNQAYAAFSPDGRWVAYASDESGKFDIYVDSYPKPGSRVRVTTAGGTEPRWNRSGLELYFRRGSEIHAVALKAGAGTIEVAAMERLFDAGAPIRSYDASDDGLRFLVNVPASSAAQRSVTIITHWQTR